jgi:hypothetical protein
MPEVDADPARWSWLHGDGCRTPFAGHHSYPVCEHGSRATILDDPTQLRAYVGTPEERRKRADAAVADAYAEWALWRDELRRGLDRTQEPASEWEAQRLAESWWLMVRAAPLVEVCAAECDRVEREVGQCPS